MRKLSEVYLFEFIAIIGLSFFCNPIYGQSNGFTMKDIPLAWKDYPQKSIAGTDTSDALTTIDFETKWRSVQISKDSARLTIEVSAYFDKNKSFVRKVFFEKSDSAQKMRLLQHEKGHWIIAMIYFKKLQNTFRKFSFSRPIKPEIDSIVRSNHRQRKAKQLKYDQETNHSLNRAEQEKWEKYLLQWIQAVYENKMYFPESVTIQRTIDWSK